MKNSKNQKVKKSQVRKKRIRRQQQQNKTVDSNFIYCVKQTVQIFILQRLLWETDGSFKIISRTPTKTRSISIEVWVLALSSSRMSPATSVFVVQAIQEKVQNVPRGHIVSQDGGCQWSVVVTDGGHHQKRIVFWKIGSRDPCHFAAHWSPALPFLHVAGPEVRLVKRFDVGPGRE